MSGYDLGQAVKASIGFMWSESYGQIYPNLKKLAADGLVEFKTEKHKGKPDRNLYSITRKGREQLVKWLNIPPQPEIPRNELLLKLFFGAQAPPQTLNEYLKSMVESHRTLLQKFERILSVKDGQNRQSPDAPFWRMTARYGQMEMQAHLAWAEESLSELYKLSRKQQRISGRAKEKGHAGN
jgi:DNA-binding PadR family transcriptional regulator